MSNTIKVSGGFSVGNSEPVDDRSIVANITARDAIESYRRYVGMETTVLDGGGGVMKKYKLSGGTANSNWVDISDNGTIQARSVNATANTIPLRDSNGKFQIKLDVDRIYIGNTFGNAEPRILPYSLTGQGGKALAVRSDLTGYEYVPFPTGSLNNVSVKSGVTGLTASKTGDTVELDAQYPNSLVQSATGYQVLKSITGNKLVGATLVQGANINISETTGETISGIPTKVLTISSNPSKILQPIKDSTNNIQIDLTTLIYRVNVSSNTTLTLTVDPSYNTVLTGNALTIELHINMTAISTVTFPVNVSWVNGVVPTINTVGKHVVALRTMDAGATWIANLAYKY